MGKLYYIYGVHLLFRFCHFLNIKFLSIAMNRLYYILLLYFHIGRSFACTFFRRYDTFVPYRQEINNLLARSPFLNFSPDVPMPRAALYLGGYLATSLGPHGPPRIYRCDIRVQSSSIQTLTLSINQLK